MFRAARFTSLALLLLLVLAGAQYTFVAMDNRDDGPIIPDHSDFSLRILPLGASITWGQKSSDGNGYREHLREMLEKRSTVVDMVGNVKSGSMKDNENEGHPGARVDQVAGWAEKDIQFSPNLILINAGTNDVLNESPQYPLNEIGERMDKLIVDLFDNIPDVTIVLSTLLVNKNEDGDRRIRDIVNPQYEAIVNDRQEDDQRIVLADLYSALKVEDLADGIHPTDEGYKKVAEAWLSAIYEAGEKGMLVEPKEGTSHNTSTTTEESGQNGRVIDTHVKTSSAVRSKPATWLSWLIW